MSFVMEENQKIDINRELMGLIKTIIEVGNKPLGFNTDAKIYPSEIHKLKIIGDKSEPHVSQVARDFGVTKGAVSQSLKKLEKKGLIERTVDQSNNTRLLVRLTPEGKKAYKAHEDLHRMIDSEIEKWLDALAKDEGDVVLDFIRKIKELFSLHVI